VNCADRTRTVVLACLLLTACAPPPRRAATSVTGRATAAPHPTHGIAAGEVTSTSAVIWSRCDRAADLYVAVDPALGGKPIEGTARAVAENDFTAKVHVGGLTPNTSYAYRAWCSAGDADSGAVGDAVSGVLRTAPSPDSPQAVRFVWGGDVGGQNACRDRTEGYPIFRTIAAQRPDFFVGLGDMVYADSPCLAQGRYGNQQIPGPPNRATDVPGFWAYWKYNREDEASQRLLASTPYYAVWDDHEVLNDFGPQRDIGPSPPYPPGRHLLPLGRKAFVDYNPFRSAPPHLYRSIRWGQQLELFLLDTRSYRDANDRADDPRHPKTMLGREQLRWLKESLRRSDATWKVIVSSVTLSVPTCVPGRGCDDWASFDQRTGFKYELLDILRFTQAHGIRNQVWISTDIHFVDVFRYTPFRDDPTFQVYEVDTGPLNAGVFPKHEYDTMLHPTQLFQYPASADPKEGFEAAKSWFNFGVMRVDESGRMRIDVINANGTQLYTLSLAPQP
jgi:alkaline phosphatase D